MTETVSDFSSGLPLDSEQVLPARPDIANWTENLLFTPYDPHANLGLWLHLGTMPWDWEFWEDRVLVALPGDEGALTMWAYHRTDPARRPGGSNLRFECLEPFRRWHVTFDGLCVRTPFDVMRTSRVSDGEKMRLVVDLEIETVSPVWDAATAAAALTGAGDMQQQEWAHEHYEQLYLARGTVRYGDQEIAFDGTGWRDHSRGPRGGAMSNWGGHVIAGCVFPESGRAFGLSRYWAPDGTPTLEGGYVVEDGRLEHARVLEVPRLRQLLRAGETLPFALEWGDRRLDVEAVTSTGVWTTFTQHMPYGATDAGSAYAVNWGHCNWDGEEGVLYVERSDLEAPMR